MVIYGAVNAFSGRERVAQRPDEKFIDSSLHGSISQSPSPLKYRRMPSLRRSLHDLPPLRGALTRVIDLPLASAQLQRSRANPPSFYAVFFGTIRATSARQLPTDHDCAVSREYQADRPSRPLWVLPPKQNRPSFIRRRPELKMVKR